ncbi:MAG: SDR family NAD(P)-dependent oxidoreductase [Actinobacteria bacterium]|nr:SDR family NAD(P)-dependent oxidoreductase [Actinomycetota bacterium]NBY15462.1 SDR family NAD(P)-dependent oxidoreductase [Actinomycetota bacterium]
MTQTFVGKTALVTGATSGIGRAFAEVLAHRGMDLVVSGRDSSRLAQIAEDLHEDAGSNVEILVADLSDRAQVDLVANRAALEDIALVVNNAGYGLATPFVGGDLASEQALLDVLVTAVMRISHAALPGLVERDFGGIINVSSVAGWLSSGTYSAAKSYVTTFSESLAMQLRESNAHVMALCPGFTRTEFQQRAGMNTETIPEILWLDPHEVVQEALLDFAAAKAVSVPSVQYKTLGIAAQYLPRPLVRIFSTLERNYRNLPR